MGVKNDDPKGPSKRMLYYYGIILLLMVFINALVVPSIAEK